MFLWDVKREAVKNAAELPGLDLSQIGIYGTCGAPAAFHTYRTVRTLLWTTERADPWAVC